MSGLSERPSRPPRENRKATKRRRTTSINEPFGLRGFDSQVNAAMARLRLHFAMRIAALKVTARHDMAVAIVALLREQEAALAATREAIVFERRQALRAIRGRRRLKRFHVALVTLRFEPKRPRRTDLPRPVRQSLRARYPKP